MADIQYDPACVRCRIDAGRDVAGTTWQCYPHVQAERDSLRLALAEATRERENWIETARTFAKGEDYYRGLIDAALKDDPAAYVADDGSISEDVLRAKLPELYALALSRAREMDGAVREAAGPLAVAFARAEAGRALQAYDECKGYEAADYALACTEPLRALLSALSSPPRPAPPSDAATEAVREAYRGLMLFPYGSPLHRKGMQRLCAALDAALSTPAPAPSAKETRT